MSTFYEMQPDQLEKSPFQLIGYEWMLITAEKDNKVNMMTASWGGLGVMWAKNVAFIVVRPQRFTKEFIDGSDTFSLTFFDKSYKKQLSYCGAVSGKDEDKLAKTGFSVVHDGQTPYFAEAKLVLLCRKMFAQAYDPASFIDPSIEKLYPQNDYHTLYIAEVTKILANSK